MKIIDLLIRRPLGTIMLWSALLLGGIWAAVSMRTDFLPDFTVPRLTVIAPYKGVPADEIRRLITIPLEDSLSSLSGLRDLKSVSRDGLSIIELEFPWGSERTEAGIRVREAIDLAWHSLPSDASKPQVLAIDPGDVPIITLAVFPKNCSLSMVRRIADRELRSRLQRIEGVGSIQVSGGYIDEVKVETDPKKIAALGFSLPDIAEALEASNIDYPAGTITEGATEYLVKTKSRAESIEALGEIYLPGGTQLKEIAELRLGSREQSSIFFTSAGEGVRMEIRRSIGYSPAAMADNLKRSLQQIRKSFAADLEIKIISDRSAALNRSMKELVVSLLSGGLFAFIVILIFIRSFTRALILLVSLPSSLLLAVLLLFISGKSLNIMSLGGLALGVGMVVDNAIVVTERLDRSTETESIQKVITDLIPSLAGSTLTTVIVFTPLLFLDGLVGSLFGDLSLSVIYSLASSLLLSLSLIPVLYMKLSSFTSGGRSFKKAKTNFRSLRRIIKMGLRKPAPVIILLTSICLICYLPALQLPIEVISPVNEGVLRCSLKLPPGISMETVKRLTAAIVGGVSSIADIESVSAWAGGEQNDPYYLTSTEESAETIQLLLSCPIRSDTELISERLHHLLSIEGGRLLIRPPENILARLIGIESSSDWVIRENSPEAARATAAAIAEAITGAGLMPENERTQLRLTPDRKALSALELSLSVLIRQISGSIRGSIPSKMLIGGHETDIRLRTDEGARNERDDILSICIGGNEAEPIRLSSVISIEEERSLPYLLRRGRKDISVIRLASPADAGLISYLRESGASRREIPVLIKQSGEILTVLALAAILLYLCLGIQFESFKTPLLLMLSIPAGASGIIAAVFLSGGAFNLNSALGILVVMGISVNNGILLFEESRKLIKKSGSTPAGALYRGTVSRLRPILMTSLTTVAALIPLAVDPFGTSSQSSLAVSVIGGISVSSIISILVLPNIMKSRLGSGSRQV